MTRLLNPYCPIHALTHGFLSITNSWLSYASCFGQSMLYGGPQATVFGLIVACAVQWLIALGLAEEASAFPSSGGRTHSSIFLKQLVLRGDKKASTTSPTSWRPKGTSAWRRTALGYSASSDGGSSPARASPTTCSLSLAWCSSRTLPTCTSCGIRICSMSLSSRYRVSHHAQRRHQMGSNRPNRLQLSRSLRYHSAT